MTDTQTTTMQQTGDKKSPVLLRASGLHKTYRMGDHELRVLRGVDASVKVGEWLAILGASGSGKSTLLHLLGGLDHPDQGDVTFEGRNIFKSGASRVDTYRNREVGFVFQFYHLLPELTALENVLIGAMIKRGVLLWGKQRAATTKRARALLEKMGLSERLNHRPNKLSGGERQRVAIARALINEPAVLLADEPTGNLDEETGKQILDIFRQLHRDGQTIVMVTHDMKVADEADRRVTLELGKLKQ